MKIQLEQRLISCPNYLRCKVCREVFEVSSIRAILYNNQGLIQGDICPECIKLKAEEIKQRLRDQAMLLIEKPELCSSQTTSVHELVLELLECSSENVKFPTFYHKFVKKIEIISQKYQLQTTK